MSLTPAATAALKRLEFFGIKLGLDAIHAVLEALGAPQERYPTVLVAGTNGKGSTSALLASMVHHAGLKVGLYTSPHLESPRERVRIGGEAAAADELSAALLTTIDVAERTLGAPPTYFEAFTAAACALFAAHRVDLAVLEVGMGGRLDATNACEPLLSVITPIGLDHQQYLGTTLAEIAREKAGILRPDRAAVAWVPAGEAADALTEAARTFGARLEMASSTTEVRGRERLGLAGQTLAVETPAASHHLRTRLLGDHQLANVALAVRAAELLRGLSFPGLDDASIARGTAEARWPGRLEPVALPGGGEVLFDGAHNADGVAVLAAFLDASQQPFDLLFGALADKDLDAMLPPLARRARRITLTRVPSPRSADPEQLVRLTGGRDTALVPDLERALARALERTQGQGAPRRLVVCGSLYLVGAVRQALRRQRGVPVAAEDLRLC